MMGEKMSLAQLNDLLRKVYERRMVRALFDDPTLPWLPESYWREEWERQQAAEAEAARVWEARERLLDHKRMRAWEDQQLERNASVADLLEEGIPSLKGDDPRLDNWGRLAAKYSGGITKRPTPGNQQPQYLWECYQCGRPITDDGKDHAGSKRCDRALMPLFGDDPEGEPWHTAKPWHGEEEDDEEGDEDDEE